MKKCSLLLCVLSITLMIATACVHSGKGNEHSNDFLQPEAVTTDEALSIIKEQKGNKNFVLLDMRTNAEFKEGYLKGHLEVTDEEPYGGVLQHDYYAADIDEWLLKLEKGRRYLLYCRTDKRAKASFDKMKAAGFKKIQYITGGYTKFANEGKPIETPEYEKGVDVHITSDKTKTKSTIKFDFAVTNLDGDPLRKAKLSLQVLLNGAEVEKKDITVDDTGKGTYTFDGTSQTKGSYRLVCTGTHKDSSQKDYVPVDAYYYFEVADEDEAVTGNSSEIKIEDDVTAEIAKEFYNRNIYGYKVYDRNKQLISLEKSVVASKPTLIVFFSPLCAGCVTKAQELIKYNLDSITFIPVLTSIDENDLENEIKKNENLLQNHFALGELIPSALYDAKDKIWLSRFKFKSTPKFILVNTKGQIKDIIFNSETLTTEAILKRMETLFGLSPFNKK